MQVNKLVECCPGGVTSLKETGQFIVGVLTGFQLLSGGISAAQDVTGSNGAFPSGVAVDQRPARC